MTRKILIGITGMPGAGKTLAAEYARKMGYPVIVMGDVIRDAVKQRGLKPTDENLGEIMLKLRRDEGQGAVAKRCIPKIENESPVVIIDGVRSLEEVEEFRKAFSNFSLIAVYCSPKARFKHLFNRDRDDDPDLWSEFVERDLRELIVGLGSTIAMADYTALNEGSKTQLKSTIQHLIRRIAKQ